MFATSYGLERNELSSRRNPSKKNIVRIIYEVLENDFLLAGIVVAPQKN